jgi:hypothetical protein
MLNRIRMYCIGKYKMSAMDEKIFLADESLKKFTGVNTSNNSGKISEWYIRHLLDEKKIEYNSQPTIYYDKKRRLQPDFYIPSKNLFIEVKSRTYNCGGTASEKVDNVARKYSTKLCKTEHYKNAKVLVVFCAGELYQESTKQLIDYNNPNTSDYIRDFVNFTKEYSILDWIDINNIHKYL